MSEEKNNEDFDISKEIDDVLLSSSSDGSNGDSDEDSKKDEKKEQVAATEAEEGEAKEESPMQQLLGDFPVDVPNEGDKMSGKVVSIEANATYLDLGTLGTGIVYGKEIKEGFGAGRKKIKIGDEVVAVVQDLENEDGYVELSIREAVREEAWQDLQKRKEQRSPIETKIIDANKGGLMLEVNSITGFMPVSQLTAEHYPRVEDGDKNKILEILKTYIGTEMQVCVIDIDPDEEKLIVSEKEANRDKEKTAIAELKVGDIVEGEVSGVVDFGAFVKFFPPSKKESEGEEDKLEGLVHISQLDWQLIDDPRKIVKVGDHVKSKIISIDDTRISLSVRQLKNDPWVQAGEKYKVNDLVVGKVHKINHFGAFVYLDKDIHGLAHVSGFREYPQKGIDEIVKTGDDYSWEIMSMEPNEHRMGLKFVGSPSKAKAAKPEEAEGEEKEDEKKDKKDKKEEKKEGEKKKSTSPEATKTKEEKKKSVKKTEKKEEKKTVVKKKVVKKAAKKEEKAEEKKPAKKTSAKKKPAKKTAKKETKKAAKKPAAKNTTSSRKSGTSKGKGRAAVKKTSKKK